MKKMLILGVLAWFAMTATSFASLNDAACQPRLELMHTLLQMNITDSQKHAIATILAKHKAEFQPIMSQMRAARQDLWQSMNSDPMDKKAVLNSYERLASAREKFLLISMDVLREIADTLNPEQQRILKEGIAQFADAVACRATSVRALVGEWVEIHSR